MKITRKIFVEACILAFLLLVVGVYSQVLIYQLAKDAETIAIENYRSLDYSDKMLQSLDKIYSFHERQYFHADGDSPDDLGRKVEYQEALGVFEKNLRLEEKNITEVGENEAVIALQKSFRDYQGTFNTIAQFSRYDVVTYYLELKPSIEKIRSLVFTILKINLDASHLKSDKPRQMANPFFFIMQIISTTSVLVALGILFALWRQVKKLEE